MKWNRFVKELHLKDPNFLVEVLEKIEPNQAQDLKEDSVLTGQQTELITHLQSALETERRDIIVLHLQKRLSAVLGREPVAGEVSRGFMDLGVDSLMSIEFRNKLKKDLGIAPVSKKQ